MPGQPSQKFPVTKNGKFFGYADAKQIARNKSLEIFDEAKAEAIENKKAVDAQKQADAAEAERSEAAKGKAADPADIKKGSAK